MSRLAAHGLVREFRLPGRSRRHPLRAVSDVSLELHAGETVALVGESGSGKSTVARILARLDTPDAGTILLDGQPATPGRRGLRHHHRQVQIVFQDPFASLNPFHTVDHHLRRPLRLHHPALGRAEEDERIHHLLDRVNLVPAGRVAAAHPHELSGGQRQRVAIARALACRPGVLLADEPVSMLDVSIRLEILRLLDRLRAEDDLAVLYITHDLATARHFAHRILVMYRGELVESGPSDAVILDPRHPYTRLLAAAAPDPRRRGTSALAGPDLPVTRVEVPGGTDAGGCPFLDRCPQAMPRCRLRPPLVPLGGGRTARCWLHAADTDPAGSPPGPATTRPPAPPTARPDP
ncbi:ABC transporter ATP-binding protein [Actinoalloteichus caeruleus]|uniref:Peptide/nickel transport system ATP-binding protein n=1 Tax=Actinoalloteichus caeruleus DSM 43889 TaxID=1120930 RepID=A0ABT1JG97_ACTCY|nr:ABC transporter ATP-binding protein [Actinoalloteichus caeruleus]MCP2331309.1 peptide/nickel transport system ATP-binding protein [Actinoalloteichus caeruleus DSM 43889]